MRSYVTLIVLVATAAGCGGAGDKVLQDFGIKDRPEGYVSGSDQVMARLPEVAKAEMNRMNIANRRGEIKFDNTDALRGRYYKEVKIYEDYHPLDANHTAKTTQQRRGGYVGYIEYTYQMYESPRVSSKVEAEAELATIPTGTRGRETYRYRFNSAGVWDGSSGERVNRR